MPGTIVITPATMRAVALRLAHCGDLAAAAARLIHGIGTLSGTSPVGPALADFRVGWGTAVGVVADDVGLCGQRIRVATDFWERLDETVFRRCATE